MEITILNDIVVIFGLAVIVLYICHKIGIPTIVGFLITGIIAGPHGLALVNSVEQVETIAEFGVILLLFSIGLEFSFKNILSIKKTILLGGSIQVGLSILFAYILAKLAGLPTNHAIFIGFLVSLSSTAIVLKQLGERFEIDAPHGRTSLGILIFQDIIVVVMMLLTPILGTGSTATDSLWLIFFKSTGLIFLIIILSLYIIPPLLYQITKTQSRELFLLSIIGICFSIAWLTSSVGLSLALGAFLAGLIIAESEYSHQALANIVPFIDTFTSLFFVSIGMLLNTTVLVDSIDIIIFLTLILIIVKGLVASIATIVLGYPIRTAILVGFSLCQIGEFSFILAQAGLENALISGQFYQGFLSASIITMMLTPFLMSIAPKIACTISNLPLWDKLRYGSFKEIDTESIIGSKEDHLVIIGYGVNGKNLARAAAHAGIPYIILEINAETVRKEREKGEPIYYGDATYPVVLEQVSIHNARIAVIAISDSAASRRITYQIRKLNPTIHIIVRTRYVADVHDLYELGANEVIPEEYETSVEIFARVLAQYMVPRQEIEEYINNIRKEDYEMFRSMSKCGLEFNHIGFSLIDMDISTLKVDENSEIVGRELGQIDFRNKYGVTVLAIRRGRETIANPNASDKICANDYLIMLGRPEDMRKVAKIVAV